MSLLVFYTIVSALIFYNRKKGIPEIGIKWIALLSFTILVVFFFFHLGIGSFDKQMDITQFYQWGVDLVNGEYPFSGYCSILLPMLMALSVFIGFKSAYFILGIFTVFLPLFVYKIADEDKTYKALLTMFMPITVWFTLRHIQDDGFVAFSILVYLFFLKGNQSKIGAILVGILSHVKFIPLISFVGAVSNENIKKKIIYVSLAVGVFLTIVLATYLTYGLEYIYQVYLEPTELSVFALNQYDLLDYFGIYTDGMALVTQLILLPIGLLICYCKKLDTIRATIVMLCMMFLSMQWLTIFYFVWLVPVLLILDKRFDLPVLFMSIIVQLHSFIHYDFPLYMGVCFGYYRLVEGIVGILLAFFYIFFIVKMVTKNVHT